MKDILLNTTMKPYGKLSKLIHEAYVRGIITSDEFAAFNEELDLLLGGQNRSHDIIPRSYMDKLAAQAGRDGRTDTPSDYNIAEEYAKEG